MAQRAWWLALAAAAWAVGCSVKTLQRRAVTPAQIAGARSEGGHLKAHLRDGGVYVLDDWRVDSTGTLVTGTGRQLDPNRALVRTGALSVPVSDVALFELDRATTSGGVAALGVVTGVTVAVAVVCLTNPKACFGSCPTFYVTDGTRPVLQAEGFSASIAPALEARDVDALFRARPAGRDLEVRMTNEALETHVVRYVRVLAAPRPAGMRVFATPEDRLVAAGPMTPPDSCSAAEGDCTAAVRAFDGVERRSWADSADLAAREDVELVFAHAPAGPAGLAVASRQTLMTTYLIYQALAYMGRSAVEWLAALDRDGAPALAAARSMGGVLGNIEVWVRDAHGDWVLAGRTGETGPIATEVKLVPLPETGPGPVHVRLRMTRGAWRLDWVALGPLGGTVQPDTLEPVRVLREGAADESALRRLRAATGVVTLPGDAYALHYELPEDFADRELFLDTRGYYLEWMRSEWLAEENHARAAQMLLDPHAALRRMAPAFKRQEAGMDSVFWRSRYARH
ncbi:MAG TPA: hypothetical protein VEH62_14935 [Gemmatimonadales bacterium]|nr:hypothetical protein [Gemmatimonadales bacterium]